jgi:hypothetical protein
MIEIGLGVLLGATLAAIAQLALSMYAGRTRMLKHYRARFFENAESLMRQERLSDDQLSRLQRMIDDIDSSAAFRALETVVADFNVELQRKPFTSDRGIISAEWASLVYSYIMVLTYRRSIRGWIIRAALANILDPRLGPDETEAIDIRLHGSASLQGV